MFSPPKWRPFGCYGMWRHGEVVFRLGLFFFFFFFFFFWCRILNFTLFFLEVTISLGICHLQVFLFFWGFFFVFFYLFQNWLFLESIKTLGMFCGYWNSRGFNSSISGLHQFNTNKEEKKKKKRSYCWKLLYYQYNYYTGNVNENHTFIKRKTLRKHGY